MTTMLCQKISKNYVQFEVNGRIYCDNISGNVVTDIFHPDLMNLYLEKYEQQNNLKVSYHDLVLISVYENHDEILYDLPNRLRELHILSSICTEIILSPENKANLEVICLDKTNLLNCPDISECSKLKLLRINNSNLHGFGFVLPPTLQHLNLSGNYLNNENVQFSILNPFLPKNSKDLMKFKLNFNDNHFRHEDLPENLTNNYLFLRQGTYRHKKISFVNVHQDNIQQMMREIIDADADADTDAISDANILKNNSQTVHLSSINQSSYQSILIMEKYIQDHELTLELKIPKNTFEPNLMAFLRTECASTAVHTMTKKTYANLVSIVWTIIQHHPSKLDMKERLRQELMDSVGYCFTGKVNRLINSMVGFIPGVKVSISYKEEIQMSIQRILTKFMECINSHSKHNIRTNYQHTMYEISELFCDIPKDILEYEKITPEYQQSWLDSVQEMYEDRFGKFHFPNPTDSNNPYEISWNNDVLFRHMFNHPTHGKLVIEFLIVGQYIDDKVSFF